MTDETIDPTSFDAWTLAETDLDYDEWSAVQVAAQLAQERARAAMALAEEQAGAEDAAREADGRERARVLAETERERLRVAAAAERERQRQEKERRASHREQVRFQVLEELAELGTGAYDRAAGKWCCAYTNDMMMTVDEIVDWKAGLTQHKGGGGFERVK
jgi:hypothetical protein